jgi:hypothetical protein
MEDAELAFEELEVLETGEALEVAVGVVVDEAEFDETEVFEDPATDNDDFWDRTVSAPGARVDDDRTLPVPSMVAAREIVVEEGGGAVATGFRRTEAAGVDLGAMGLIEALVVNLLEGSDSLESLDRVRVGFGFRVETGFVVPVVVVAA